jgi:hypothetical protein
MNLCYANSLRRVVALLVVSLTCFCMLEDLFALGRCAEDQEEVGIGRHAPVISQERSPEQSQHSSSTAGDHDCLCCCRHVVPGAFFHPQQNWSFSYLESSGNTTALSAYLFPPYHPPQA